MKVAYIHYHVKPGGVTTVLKHQLNAVGTFGEGLVISGEPPAETWPVKVFTIPGIAYDSVRTDLDTPRQIVQHISDAIRSHWPGGCDLIHIHNPTLAKNRSFLNVIDGLQQIGIPLFLQIHDFAEDGRPQSFYHEPYPENCHYGVINPRDYGFLAKAGLQRNGLHLLPNAVQPESQSTNHHRLPECILYPVRAIRRKNLGEAVLLSVLWEDIPPVRITLPPNSPADIKSYDSWRQFTDWHHLKIEYETGLTHGYHDLIGSARWILTTSITEGFGFGFLEPWLLGKSVRGRYLDGICFGFQQAGVRFPYFYNSIEVPWQWIGRSHFLNSWQLTLETVSRSYRLPIDENKMAAAAKILKDRETIDFGWLNEAMQQQVIENVMANKTHYKTLITLNRFLADIGSACDTTSQIRSNADSIKEEFGPKPYATRLKKVYQHVLSTPVKQRVDKKSLLDGFLNPHAFSLLKWGTFVG